MSATNRPRRGTRGIARASRRAGVLAILSALILLVGQFAALAGGSDNEKQGLDSEVEQTDGSGSEEVSSSEDESESEDSVSDEESDVESDSETEVESDTESDTEEPTGQGGGGGNAKITICHRTDSATNPYVQITVSVEAANGVAGDAQTDHFGEHRGPVAFSLERAQELKDDHIEWGDIIPDEDDDGNPMPHDGLNWDAQGQAMLENGCEFVTPPQGNLSITKSGPATSTVGGIYSYNVTVTNTGTTSATNVTVTDNVPAGLSVTAVSFTKANPAAASVNCTAAQSVSCNVGTLVAGQSATVTISVSVGLNACPAVSNSASVSADGISAKTSNTVVTTIPCPPSDADLSIVKSGPASSTVGGSFSYSILVTNNGTGPANNVTVTDNVSGALTVTGVTFTSPSGPGTCPTSQNVNCNVGTLLAGQSATVTIAVTVGPNACPSITNTAAVRAGGVPSESSNGVTTTVPCPPNQPSLSLNKTGTATVTEGGAITYTVTVTNSGTAAATNVVITDNLNDSLTSVTASSTIGTCAVAAGNVVTCNVGTLAAGGSAGASATITINALAPNDSCPTITNQATGTHSGGTIPSSGTVTTTVTGCGEPEPDLSVLIQKTNDANEDGIFTNNEESKNDGRDVEFELVITNTSDVAVSITDLTDSFGQTTLDLLDDECASLTGTVLDPGESVVCTFTLNNYSPPQGTAIVNVAEVCVEIVGGTEVACDTNPSRVHTAIVLGTTVTPTPTNTPPGPVVTATPPGGIAFTGPSSALPLTLLALALLTLGTGLLWAGRRRERPDMG